MKYRVLSLILALTFILLTLAACGGDKAEKDDPVTEPSESRTVENVGHPLYIRAAQDAEITASFFSALDTDGDVHTIAMNKVEDEDNTAVYCCYADPNVYDRVTVTVDGRDSDPLAFNEYTDGWELSPGREIPFVYGRESETPQFERKQFPYQKRTKDILIWTPQDYDANAPEKYSVIYMTDGHNLFDPNATSTGCWAVAESVETMMNYSKHKAIVVGVENMDGWRDDELTPNLGEPTSEEYKDGHGEYFCDFVVNTVMPYVEKNYNVYTDREHTAICGSSSGGIESFYIAMEHPEKFGTVGALSPAFSLYDDEIWQQYLKEKDFSAGYPRVWLYCGKGDDLERYLYAGYESMPENLKSIGYPAQNIESAASEKATHCELYWRIVFPDFLKFMFV